MGISLEKVSYVYEQGTAMETAALLDIDLEIPDNQFIGLIGHTGFCITGKIFTRTAFTRRPFALM